MKPVFAQTLTLPWESGQQTITGLPLPFSTLGDVVFAAIPYVFAAAGFGLLLMIIFAGFSLLTSAGDAKKLEAGKQRLTTAITGFIVIFSAYWVVQILGKVFGLQEIQHIFPF